MDCRVRCTDCGTLEICVNNRENRALPDDLYYMLRDDGEDYDDGEEDDYFESNDEHDGRYY